MDSQTWDQLTKILWTPHQKRTQGDTSTDIKNLYNQIKYVYKCGEYTLIRPSSCLPVHQNTLWFLTILCTTSVYSSIILEYKYLKLPWTLPFYGPDKWNLCKIIHVTSGLQGCQHACSWNILMGNSIQKYTHPSYWRYKWWSSICHFHPVIQEWRTNWIVSDYNYQTSTVS